MTWLFELHKTQPIAHAIGVLAIVCVFGMALGSLKVRGIGLGTAGVLFAGILVGHFGETMGELDLDDRFGVAVTRITGSDIEMSAVPDLRLQYGDTVQIVGSKSTWTKWPVHWATHSRNSAKCILFPFLLVSSWGSYLGQCRSWFLGCHIQSGSVLREVH